jgi:hypothetical protein
LSLSIKFRLLSVVDKLVKLASRSELARRVAAEFPEASTRSSLLVLHDESGRMALHFSLDGGRLSVREVDPSNPPFATNEVSMHVDTFIALLKRRIGFWTAYLHDLIDVRSNDGLPASYHVLLWGAFFDRLFSEVLR